MREMNRQQDIDHDDATSAIDAIAALVRQARDLCDRHRLIAIAIDLSLALDKLESEKN